MTKSLNQLRRDHEVFCVRIRLAETSCTNLRVDLAQAEIRVNKLKAERAELEIEIHKQEALIQETQK